MLPWQIFDCPKCGQLKGSRCRTLKTGRVTDTHMARVNIRVIPEYYVKIGNEPWRVI